MARQELTTVLMGPLWRIVCAIAGGLTLALAYPPFGLWPLAPIGVGLVVLSVVSVRAWTALGLGAIVGVSFFLILLRWADVVGLDAWLLLTAYSSFWFALTTVGICWVTRLRWWLVWVPAVWVLQEAIRDRVPLGGWPWGRLGFSQADAPAASFANWGSVAGLTFLVAAAGSLLAAACLRRPVSVASVGGPIVAALGLLLIPALIPLPVAGEDTVAGTQTRIAVIQGDTPRIGLGTDQAERAEVLRNHISVTTDLAAAVDAGTEPQPDFVLWPENASDVDPLIDSLARTEIDETVQLIGVPILVGAVITNQVDPDTALNVGIVWEADGPGQMYVKRHPVPFGEYIPGREWLEGYTGRFDLIPRDFAAGDEVGLLDVNGVPVGDVICFEIVYDEIARDVVQAGATMLTVQSNNATYTGTGQSEQQLAISRLRAIEHGRTVAVATTNGISAVFLPDGQLVGSLPERSAGWLNTEVPLRDSLSIADRLSAYPEFLVAALGVLLLVLGVRRQPGLANPFRGQDWEEPTSPSPDPTPDSATSASAAGGSEGQT